jgi:hypothetical protein
MRSLRKQRIVLLLSCLGLASLLADYTREPSSTLPVINSFTASAQVITSPGNVITISAQVPADIPGGAQSATLEDAAVFAWQEFIALHWPAVAQTGAAGNRETPDMNKKFGQVDPPFGTPLVWETFRHKIAYDIVQPFLAPNGNRYSVLSTNGYVISAASKHPKEAWTLVQALLEPAFLAEVWGRAGHFVPARKSAAESVLESPDPPANRQAIVDVMAYGEVFKPYTPSAFEAYAQTQDLFAQAMRGDLPVAEALEQIETVANGILAQDRDGPSCHHRRSYRRGNDCLVNSGLKHGVGHPSRHRPKERHLTP